MMTTAKAILRSMRLRVLLPVVMAAMLCIGLTTTTDAQGNPNVRPPAGAVGNAVPPPPPDGNRPVIVPERGGNYDIRLWERVRQGEAGYVSVPAESAGILVQSQGEDWRLLRDGKVKGWGGLAVLAVGGLIALYFLVRGRIRIADGRTGRVIPRFSLTERVVHWLTAGLWLLLAITGLILLFGRTVLIPVIGPAAFAAIANASMQAHNLLGPVFTVSTVLLLVTFIRGNFFRLVDLKWILKGGGFFGGHASSHRYNFGEKSWFWAAVMLGIVISVSGFAMLFPELAGSRATLQLANVAHAVAALAFIAFGLGHIYLATIGMEGALEGMTRGTVDENWAKEHHDLWWQDHKDEARVDVVSAEADAALGRV